MSEKEFSILLEKLPFQDYVVCIQLKYPWEKCYRITHEILEADNDHYVWLNDWDEGETDVTIMGFIPVDDIEVPPMEEAIREYMRS